MEQFCFCFVLGWEKLKDVYAGEKTDQLKSLKRKNLRARTKILEKKKWKYLRPKTEMKKSDYEMEHFIF